MLHPLRCPEISHNVGGPVVRRLAIVSLPVALVVVVSAATGGCGLLDSGKPPVADFRVDPLTGIYPLRVSFTDTSSGVDSEIKSWAWNFGDGGTSQLKNPEHTYTEAGTFTVSLTVTSENGSNTVTKKDCLRIETPESDHWYLRARIPGEYKQSAVAVLGNNIYVTGGYVYGSSPREYRSDVQVYDTTMDQWIDGTPMPITMAYHVSASINDRIYIAGGNSSVYVHNNSLRIYDPLSDDWTSGAQMIGYPGDGIGGETVDGKLYVIGPNASFVYDPIPDSWTGITPMPIHRMYMATSAINGELFVTGGIISDYTTSQTALEIYNPATDSWSEGTPLPNPTGMCTGAVIDGQMYVINGYYLYAYDPLTGTWNRKTSKPMFENVSYSCNWAAVVDNKLYVCLHTGWTLVYYP
jgi:PKD repeat protein